MCWETHHLLSSASSTTSKSINYSLKWERDLLRLSLPQACPNASAFSGKNSWHFPQGDICGGLGYLCKCLGDHIVEEETGGPGLSIFKKPRALLYRHSGNFYGRKGEMEKASGGEDRKEEREGPMKQVLLPALQSLSSKTEKKAVQAL